MMVNRIAAGLTVAAGALLAASASAEEITWWEPNWGTVRARELVKQFEAANPGITVKIEETVADGLQNKVQVALRAGTPPDVIDINNGWNVPFAATGQVAALDDWIKRDHVDLSDIAAGAQGSATWQGKLYGMPFRVETHAMLYNKAMFRDAGLDPEKFPETWADLLAAAKKLTKVNAQGKQQYGYGLDGGGEVANMMSRALPFIWGNGGSVLSDDETKAVVNQAPAVEAVTFYTDLFVKEGVAPPSTLQNDGLALRRLFTTNTIAMYASGQYDLPAIKAENPTLELGIGKLPHAAGKPVVAVLSGWNFIIPKQSKHAEAAWKLVKFLSEPEHMGYYTDTYPARASSMTLPRFQDPALKGFRDMLPFGRTVPSNKAWVQIVQIFYDRVQGVLLKQQTPQEAMDAAAKQIQGLLAKS